MTATNEILLPFKYDFIELPKTDSLCIAIKKGKYGVIQLYQNRKPIELVSCEYQDIIRQKYAFQVQAQDKFGLIDFDGQVLLPVIYQSIIPLLLRSKSYYIVSKKSKLQLLDNKGKPIHDELYQNIQRLADFRLSKHGPPPIDFLAVQTSNNLWGVMDLSGALIISPQFTVIQSKIKDNLVIKSESHYGVYNIPTETLIIPTEYDQIIADKTLFYGIKGKEMFQLMKEEKVAIKKL